MILVLLGTDDYRKRERRLAAIEEFGVPTSEVVRIEGEGATVQTLDDALLSLGLFATKRAVLVSDAAALLKPVASRLVELLPSVDDQTLLILEADKLDQRTELAKSLKKLPTETFEPLKGTALEQWVGEQAHSLGVTIEPVARMALIAAVGDSSWRLKSELEKLAIAVLQQNPPRITATLVKELTLTTTNPTLFALTDALVARNAKVARVALAKLVASGEAPLGIMGLLAHHLRTLTLVKDAEETGVPATLHPFVVRKTTPAARTVPWPVLARWYERLAEYDWQVKTGKIEAELALELMVYELSTIKHKV